MRLLSNLIQQRLSAFAVGVGKPQKPAKPVSVFPHVTPQLAGECRVIQCQSNRLLAKSETLADLGEADVSRGRRLANEATDELRDRT